MAVKLGNGNWAVKEDKLLAYNDNSGLFFNKEFDFSRGTSATYVAKDGLIKTAGIQPNIVNNGDFSELGSELVTNGTFDTDSDWIKETGWTISDGKANKTSSVASNFAQLNTGVFTNNNIYKITFTISNSNDGRLLIYIGGNSVTIDITNATNGTYTFYGKADGQDYLIFRNATSGFQGSIDNVSIKQVDPNDYWTLGSDWTFGDGRAVFDTTSNSSFVGNLNISSGKLYRVKIEGEVTSGNIKLSASSGLGNDQVIALPFQQDITHDGGANTIEIRTIGAAEGFITNISVQEIQTDTPRIDFTNDTKGHLLLEPSRTNIITYSEDFSEWTNTRTSTSTDETLSPKGELFSYKLTETNDTGFHGLFKNETVSSGVSHTFSVFLKKGTSSFVQILFGTNNVSGNPYVNFDVNNGVLQNYGATSTKIEEYLNEWYRCSVTITTATTSLSSYVSPIQSITSSRVESFTGDINKYFYLFGAQLEAGSYPTSLIYTTGAASTRNADVCNNSGSAQDFNDSEGVLYAEIKKDSNALDNAFSMITIGDALNNRLQIYLTDNSNDFGVLVGSSSGTTDISSTFNYGSYNKIALSYNSSGFKVFHDGTLVGSNSNTISGLNLQELKFRFANNTSYDFYGDVKCVAVFTEALTDEQLEKLTS